MKLVIAVIRPEKMETVKEELHNYNINMMTVIDVQGHGRQMGHTEVYRGREYKVDFINKVEVQVAVPDEKVDTVIETITKAARTDGDGAIGDGKIFVLPLERVVRIRTGEENEEAL